jgi:hypothetical protein
VEPGVGSTARDLATWLANLPGLASTAPAPITIDGYQGLVLDLSVAPTWTTPSSCQFSGPKPMLFTFTDPVPLPAGQGVFVRTLIEAGARARYVLLDLGAGHNLLIEVSAPDTTAFYEFASAAMPVLESFQFTPAGP